MNIAILTYHCVPNFGAQLQALSTVCYLKNAGYNPIVLHWYPSDLEKMYAQRVSVEQRKAHDTFTSELLPITNICRNETELIQTIHRLDITKIIVGSDALFKYLPILKRFRIDRKNLRIKKTACTSCEKIKGNPFFGGFLSNFSSTIKAAVFSVSSQNCPYKAMLPCEKSDMKKVLNNYAYISVRDQWTKDMVEEILGVANIKITPDPVFSFNQNCSPHIPNKSQILHKYGIPHNYILLSFGKHYINEKYLDSIVNEIRKQNYCPVWLPMPENDFSVEGIDFTIPSPIPPLDWYALIKYAYGYIGERMHPIVVSLHNCVPFYCFDEYGIKTFTGYGLKRQYNKFTSKTYLIVKEAGLEENLCSYHIHNPLPSPSHILEQIIHFDKEKCCLFANRKLAEYQSCMDTVLQTIL